MKNIFSFIPNEWLLSLNKKNPSNEDDFIGQVIYKYIPLKDIEAIIGFTYFKNALVNKIKSTDLNNIDQIADIALSLCVPYLRYEIPHSGYDQLQNLSNSSQNLIPYPLIKEFHKELYEINSYHTELKNLMILSYCYTQSIGHVKITELASLFAAKKSFVTKSFTKKSSEKKINDDSREIDPDPRLLHDKLYLIYKSSQNSDPNKTRPLFLSPFLEYNESDTGVNVNSWYESEIFLGLIQSNTKSKNPFIWSKRTTKLNQPIKTNLDIFLDCFHDININKNRRISTLDFANKSLLVKGENSIHIYNQFFLERLTNINFINHLYDIQNTISVSTDTISPLVDFVNSPLLRFRLKVLDFHEEHYLNIYKHNHAFLAEWNGYIENVLTHQLVCTLPILALVFHYLIHLIKSDKFYNKGSFENSIYDYFANLDAGELLKFFKYDMDKNYKPTPCLYNFPNNIYDKDYAKFNDTVYENLLCKTDYFAQKESFSHRLNEIYYKQQDFLTKELLKIHFPLNIDNPAGIIKD